MSNDSFSASKAEEILMGLLERRDVILSEPGFNLSDVESLSRFGVQSDWVRHSQEVYAWSTRSPLALLYCGLLARATSSEVDPLSIQGGSGDRGYNAAGLWKDVINKHAVGRIDLRHLKNVPFNNSPFNGKRRLSKDWENVSAANLIVIQDLFEMLTEVADMTPREAESALLSLLLAAPSAAEEIARVQSDPTADYPMIVSLVDFADEVSKYIVLNSDNGRRAQAFVAACLEVAFPDRVVTPASINDPSRTSPGDVKLKPSKQGAVTGYLLVEVKDKVTRRQDVQEFAREVRNFDQSATVAYAALANKSSAEERLAPQTRIPNSEELTRSMGIPVLVWKTPLEMIVQAAAWSGLPTPSVIYACAYNYLHWLNHLDTGAADSTAEWANRLKSWGFEDWPAN